MLIWTSTTQKPCRQTKSVQNLCPITICPCMCSTFKIVFCTLTNIISSSRVDKELQWRGGGVELWFGGDLLYCNDYLLFGFDSLVGGHKFVINHLILFIT